MPKFKVEITRTTYTMLPFIVEAADDTEAGEKALEAAANHGWPSGQNVEYEVEYSEEVEPEEADEDDTAIKTWDTIES